MIKKKFLKIITAVACIMALIMPHTSVVLAAAITNDYPNEVDTVTLASSEYHEKVGRGKDHLRKNLENLAMFNDRINIKINTMANICKRYVPKGIEIQFCKIDVESYEKKCFIRL